MVSASSAAAEAKSSIAAPVLIGLQRVTAFDSVRVRIGLAVDLGLLKPNERLPSTADIAGALEVSEITVRRALESLCAEGVLIRLRGRTGGTLVSAKPRRGAVREIAAYRASADRVHQLIDQRLVFDCGLAALAAASISKRALQELRKHVQAMDVAESWAQFHRSDEQFHRAVARASRLKGAEDAYEPVLHELYRFYLPYPIEYLRDSNQEHRQLVAALEIGDTDGAVRIARNHVETLHKSMFVGLLDAANRSSRSR